MGVRVPSAGEVLITPRVLDQASFDDLAASLQALIKQAGTTSGELRGVLRELAEGRAEASAAELAKLLARGERGHCPDG
jgi:hypothetical protein